MVPTWSAVTKALLDDGFTSVSFAEVECRSAAASCSEHEAGKRGWPTLKVFSPATGPAGAHYKQRDAGMVCDELKKPERMKALIEETAAAAAAAAASAATTSAAGSGGGGEL